MPTKRPSQLRPGLPVLITAAFIVGLAQPSSAAAADRDATAYQRSYEREAAGQYRAALKALGSVRGQDKSYFLQLRLGWLRYRAGDHRAAVQAYRKAASLTPRAVEPWLGITLPQMALRLWKDAEQSARKALRLDANNFLANSRLAWTTYNLGRYSEAERLYNKVLRLYPSDLQMRAGLGWSLLKQGKKAAAVKAFAEVLSVSPKNPSATEGLRASFPHPG
jgi:tetratricopeptide (TPR) repeat protein